MSNQGALPDPFIGLVGMVDVGRRYSNAPIVEATVDLRVLLSDDVGIDDLSGLYPDLEEPQPFFEFIPRVEDNRIVASNDRQAGFTFSKKKSFGIIAGLDRFAYSQLSKYSSWEDFIENVRPRWLRYKQVASPEKVTNVGVRYVNRIVIPKRQVEINDYLRTKVDISPYLPQAINRYFAQISFPINAYDAEATVNTALVEAPEPDATALVVDIDVSRELDLDPASDSFDEDLTAQLGTLRSAKNYVFEACITDATRGVIDSGVHEAQPPA
ncbi:TIGR04255 family protein [Mycobacterium shinjukuense]|uniref:Uncharacterized protein n=1 Tax=Mycobacterium shinjukuense TaxID=398694 RepID=A0A7I7MTF6_9MYCO|nr:TIGR04255 family protein [Mycobacterium shinjukuense]MCV6986497.1 TIGR04255 family protein [Mycobacterium shinjukuense]ORB70635.1 hypothetical protein BST45_05685 [Mycobacterium shinjukuense]BBX75455.1 hypothetical protein MSHI_33610 [Mycobacterium shinjukuense]